MMWVCIGAKEIVLHVATKILAEPPSNCFSDMLGETEFNPARFCRTGLLRGCLHLMSTTRHANSGTPDVTPRATILCLPRELRQVLTGLARRRREHFGRTCKRRTSGIVSSHALIGSISEAHEVDVRLVSELCTGSCGKAGSPHTIMLPNSLCRKRS